MAFSDLWQNWKQEKRVQLELHPLRLWKDSVSILISPKSVFY